MRNLPQPPEPEQHASVRSVPNRAMSWGSSIIEALARVVFAGSAVVATTDRQIAGAALPVSRAADMLAAIAAKFDRLFERGIASGWRQLGSLGLQANDASSPAGIALVVALLILSTLLASSGL